MKKTGCKRGFTLIELLVVVLIIGILAAVAVPQYQKAVTKSRLVSILPIMHAIRDAQEVYYLSNGKYTTDVSKLDVKLSADCSVRTANDQYQCGDSFVLDLDASTGGLNNGKILANYCPGETSSTCISKRMLRLDFFYKYNVANGVSDKIICTPYTTKGKNICAVLGKPFVGGDWCPNTTTGCTEL